MRAVASQCRKEVSGCKSRKELSGYRTGRMSLGGLTGSCVMLHPVPCSILVASCSKAALDSGERDLQGSEEGLRCWDASKGYL